MRCLELWPRTRREEKEGAIVLYLTNGLLQDVQLHYQANRLLLCCFINNVVSTPTTNNLKFHTFVYIITYVLEIHTIHTFRRPSSERYNERFVIVDHSILGAL